LGQPALLMKESEIENLCFSKSLWRSKRSFIARSAARITSS
jgi:hypothetical protein